MRRRRLPPSLPLLVSFAAALACRSQPSTTPPELPAEGGSGVEDAQRLPGFETTASARADDGIERYFVPLGDAPARGPKDAAITVVMFSDFECPYCGRGHEIMGELLKRHPSSVRIAYKAFPLDMHPHALLAAMAARSAQAQGKFWDFHDRLFSQQGIDADTLFRHATASGLDIGQLKQDLEQLEYGPEVSRDLRLGRRLGVHSTPTFFVNGRLLTGAQPLENFEAVIEDEMQHVEQWRKQGVAATQTYEHAIADGYRKVVFTDDRHPDPDLVVPVPLGDSPQLGPADAPVTIVAFGDFECPFCVRGNDTVEQLREQYGTKLRIVYKHTPLPFHSHAYLAARASMAAHAQGKFWAYHDALYERKARFDEDDLDEIAREVGLDLKKYRKAMNGLELDRAIEVDQKLAMNLGVTGTPAYFINGRPVHGAQPELVFRMMIEEELDRAAAAKAAGVASSDLYEALTHTQLSDAPSGK